MQYAIECICLLYICLWIINLFYLFLFIIIYFFKGVILPLFVIQANLSLSHAWMTLRWPMGQFRKPQEFLESLFVLILI